MQYFDFADDSLGSGSEDDSRSASCPLSPLEADVPLHPANYGLGASRGHSSTRDVLTDTANRPSQAEAAVRKPSSQLSSCELFKQSFGLGQVGCVEALSEPAEDRRQKTACVFGFTLSAPQLRQTDRGLQLE